MKILKPVPVEKRLPAILEGPDQLFSRPVIVDYKIGNYPDIYKAFAYRDKNEEWHDTQGLDEKEMRFISGSRNKIIAWYEEIEVESLFPDDNTSSTVAVNASNKSFAKTLSHQEGQTYIQNYIIKKLKS